MEAPETIYLIPDDEHGYVWCEDPAPGAGMDESDAIEYVRIGKNKPCVICGELLALRCICNNYYPPD